MYLQKASRAMSGDKKKINVGACRVIFARKRSAKKCHSPVLGCPTYARTMSVMTTMTPRKRRFASRKAGAWAGLIVETDDLGVYVTVSQEKWDKTKRHIGDITEELSRTNMLCHKDLERKRGFLIYVTRTYPSMVPCLKGTHQTLEMW